MSPVSAIMVDGLIAGAVDTVVMFVCPALRRRAGRCAVAVAVSYIAVILMLDPRHAAVMSAGVVAGLLTAAAAMMVWRLGNRDRRMSTMFAAATVAALAGWVKVLTDALIG